jgi:hypothetical protein
MQIESENILNRPAHIKELVQAEWGTERCVKFQRGGYAETDQRTCARRYRLSGAQKGVSKVSGKYLLPTPQMDERARKMEPKLFLCQLTPLTLSAVFYIFQVSSMLQEPNTAHTIGGLVHFLF